MSPTSNSQMHSFTPLSHTHHGPVPSECSCSLLTSTPESARSSPRATRSRSQSTTFDDTIEVWEFHVEEALSPIPWWDLFPLSPISSDLESPGKSLTLGCAPCSSGDSEAQEADLCTYSAISQQVDHFSQEAERRKVKRSVTSNVGLHSSCNVSLNMRDSSLWRRRGRGSAARISED